MQEQQPKDDDYGPVKTCNYCHADKPTSDFNKKGLKCKACTAAYNQAYHAGRKPERRAYDAANKERFKERNRKAGRLGSARWRKANPDRNTNNYLRQLYGITLDDYNAIFDAQDGACKICSRPWNPESNKRLAVDHCHATKKIRGLLCDPCNVALGNMQDNPERLEAAAAYLREHAV